MDDQHSVVPNSQPEHRPFQFTLRTMFIVTTVVAMWCSGLFAPYALSQLVTVTLWVFTVPVVLVVMLIYGRGYMRTFAIGGLFTTFPLLICHVVLVYSLVMVAISLASGGNADWSDAFGTAIPDESRLAAGLFCAGYTAVIFLFGFLAMGVRWMVESPQRTARKPHLTFNVLQEIPEPEFEMGSATQESDSVAG